MMWKRNDVWLLRFIVPKVFASIWLVGLGIGCQRTIAPMGGSGLYYNEDATWLIAETLAQRNEATLNVLANSKTDTHNQSLAIDSALFHLDERLRAMRAQGTLSLYALQVYQGYSRQEALHSRDQIQRYLKGTYTTHIRYRQPHYIVQVQYFYTPLEAHRLYALIASRFPQTILLPIQVPTQELFPSAE